MSINAWMDKENTVYVCNRKLFSLKKKRKKILLYVTTWTEIVLQRKESYELLAANIHSTLGMRLQSGKEDLAWAPTTSIAVAFLKSLW